jgi:VWFA-related protein
MRDSISRRLLLAQAVMLPAALAQRKRGAAKAEKAPPPVEQTEREQTITLDVTRINILYTVTDKKGRFVNNLVKEDFELYEDKRRQSILEFNAESDLPLRIGILIDTSNSIRDRFRFEVEAASEFLNSIIRRNKDKAMVVSFDSAAELVVDLTDDTELLSKRLRNLRPGGGTAMYDALFYMCRDKLAQDRPLHKFRRAVVIIGDGDDNASRHTRDQALELAQKTDAGIYCISTNITKIESRGDKVLKYFARETGGVPFFPFKVSDLAQSFENIANELRSQYSILYRPEPLRTDGLYHQFNIKVPGRKDLVVRSRKGYYAPRA